MKTKWDPVDHRMPIARGRKRALWTPACCPGHQVETVADKPGEPAPEPDYPCPWCAPGAVGFLVVREGAE